MGTDAPRTRRHRGLIFLTALLITVLVLGIAAAGFGWWTVQRSFPTTSGRIDVPGLTATVTVYRDDAGIPQLVAETDHDLFFAQGYVHAQDRFWEMDFRRHVTAGRVAELFGESQVATDAFIRTLDWRGIAEQEYALLDEVSRAYYDAYAEGVNAYLGQRDGADLSLEYAVLGLQNPGYTPEPWTPVDSIAWLKAMAWDLRSNLVDEIDRALLAAALPPEEVARLHPGFAFGSMPTIIEGAPAAARRRTRRRRRRAAGGRRRHRGIRPRDRRGRRGAAGLAQRPPRRRARDARPRGRRPGLQLVGRVRRPHRVGPAAARERPAPRPGHAVHLGADGAALRGAPRRLRLRRRRLHVLGTAGRHHRPQRAHRVGVHEPRSRRRGPLPRARRRRHVRARRRHGPPHRARGDHRGRGRRSGDRHGALDRPRAARHRRRFGLRLRRR